MDKSNSKPKLKPAKRYVSKDKISEVKEKMQDIHASVDSTQNVSIPPDEPPEQSEDADVVVPDSQTVTEPPDTTTSVVVSEELKKRMLSNISVQDFCVVMETALHLLLDNRDELKRKAELEELQKTIEAGEEILTVKDVLVKCTGFMKSIAESYNLYAQQKSSVSQQQKKVIDIVKDQLELSDRLGNIIGRIEKVQGVKAPKRPPFPSWACLTYLFWHWPMYAFACMWLSKYFRRFCFLITFFVIVLQFCVIVLLAGDNKTMHYAVSKYNTVRNWSLVDEDSSAMDRFNKVDGLFEDPEFNQEEIIGLRDTIKSKHERLMEKRRKEMERGLRR